MPLLMHVGIGTRETEAGGEARMIDELLAAVVPKKAQFPVVIACILMLVALVGLALFL